ncbi:SCO family protein [Reinekea sp.]|jgi:protein SCO1/2|uniref:SCO family protein n=1 Tax=Reinekea sp. TaxID=1970455 RepID=UPI003988FA36
MNPTLESNRVAKQKRTIWITVGILVLFIVSVITSVVLQTLAAKPDMKSALEDYQVIWFNAPRLIPDVALVDHNGEAFSIEQLKGQWDLINFGYTYCPDICPTNMADMNITHRLLGEQGLAEQISFWMITVDPARDTTEQLSLYVPYFNEEFVGLTGDIESIQTIATALSAVFYQEGTEAGYTVAHSDNYAVIDPNGHLVAILRPPHNPQAMAEVLAIMIQANY